jgi:hypothetical protein
MSGEHEPWDGVYSYANGDLAYIGDEIASSGTRALVVGYAENGRLFVQLKALPPPWGTGVGWTDGTPSEWLAVVCWLMARRKEGVS